MKKKPEDLVEAFAHQIVAQTEAISSGSGSKKINKHSDRADAIFKELCQYGDQGRGALATLFSHDRMDVRVAAAAYLLRFRTSEAKEVLQEAAKGQGLIPFTAQQILKRWEEGTWALDPE